MDPSSRSSSLAYPRGTIKCIKVKDFMSFTGPLVTELSPKVNLVAGPNGSGKSSLVTAICVGLAGPMKNLGRQTQPGELIRRGCHAFETEITLSGGPGQPDMVVFRRTEQGSKRRRTDGAAAAAAAAGAEDDDDDGEERVHTVWRIDGEDVPQKRVTELTHSLGIHFDNLCQFLPQERVQEFTNLNPAQLLESTEEAIGDGVLLRQHNELKERSKQLQTKRGELDQLQKRLARVEGEQQAAAPEYQRLQRRNALRRQVDRMRLKVLWLGKEAAAARAAEARQQAAGAELAVEAALAELQRAEAPLGAQRTGAQRAKRTADTLVQQAEERQAAAQREQAALNRLEESLRAKEEQLQRLSEDSRTWHRELAAAREALQRVREERAALPPGPPPQLAAQLLDVENQLQHAHGQAAAVDMQVTQRRQDQHRLDVEIRALQAAADRRDDRREQILNKLERLAPGSRELYNWINERRTAGGFRGRVFGPVVLEISEVVDPDWASYVEHLLKLNSASPAVVTENIQDNNDIQDWLEAQRNRAGRRHGNGKPPFTNKVLCVSDPNRSITYPHGEANAQLAQLYGITHTLDQVFEAPHMVKLALCNVCGINVAYIGSRATDSSRVINDILRSTRIRKIFTPGKGTFANTSLFDPTLTYQNLHDVKPAWLYAGGVGAGDEDAELQRLQEKQQERAGVVEQLQPLLTQQAHWAGEVARLRAEQQRLQTEQRQFANRSAQLQRREEDVRRKLQGLERRRDPLREADALREDLRRGAEAMAARARQLLGQLQEQHALHRDLAVAQLAAAAAAAALQPLQAALERARGGLRTAEAALAAARQRVAAAQQAAAEAAGGLREALGGRDRPDAELRAAWSEWPDDAEALQALLEEKQDEAERAQAAMRGDEAQVLEAWARRETELAELRKSVGADTASVDALAADLAAKKAAWLPALQRHMGTISDSVRAHFAAIGCAGEVALREAGDAYEEYAAEIRVSYRPEEPLLPLNRNRHSGGERSVATMLYLMALQGVTTTPFRVVDEINQGMDSRNERKVFNLLVECSSRPDTPQCLLLTPKVIANLRYNDHVRVLNIVFAASGAIGGGPQVGAEWLELAEAAAAAEGGGSREGARPTGRARRQQQQRHQGGAEVQEWPGLGQVPWQLIKRHAFFGRRAALARSEG